MSSNNSENKESQLSALLLKQEEQAGKVRALKKSGTATTQEIEKEIEILVQIKEQVSKLKETVTLTTPDIRGPLNSMLLSSFFYAPAFEIYGGVAGFYDFGPPGAALKKNLIDHWRNFFVIREGVLELDASLITPEKVLETSGHVAKFADLMVRDVKNGNCYRADHLLEQQMELLLKKEKDPVIIQEMEDIKDHADTYPPSKIDEIIKKFNIKAPDTKNDLTPAEMFNLMFPTQIGPTGSSRGFLRPETAQGMFINFKRLLEYNHGRLPFGAAQMGPAFRNEIKPQQGLLRVREFALAEVEYFVHPERKDHPKFNLFKDTVMHLFPQKEQLSTRKILKITLGEAVKSGMIANQTLGFWMAKCQQWLSEIGIDLERLRFRQHLPGEMAHYASDCWDAEIHTTYGWIECVGNADRSCYDLTVHAKETREQMTAFEYYPEGPREVERIVLTQNKQLIGKTFKNDAKLVNNYLEDLDQNGLQQLQKALQTHKKLAIPSLGKSIEITDAMVSFKTEKKRENGYHYVPSVIEPAFGIGRIMYALLEHSYYTRENDEQRSVLRLRPVIAPVKVSVLPLLGQEAMNEYSNKIAMMLSQEYIPFKVDETAVAIGRRYARTDQIGIPFAITVDHQTLQDHTVTLRERDSCKQVRIPVSEVVDLLLLLIRGKKTWDDVWTKYPHTETKEE